jgi:hypothetical protein
LYLLTGVEKEENIGSFEWSEPIFLKEKEVD